MFMHASVCWLIAFRVLFGCLVCVVDVLTAVRTCAVLQANWTIARAINTGVMYPSSFVGCHAGDHESYTITTDLTDLAKSKIVSTRIRVARNLSFFPLNPGMG